MKIALVHDWLLRIGGAERVLIAFHKIFPEAPIFTLFYDKKFSEKYLPAAEIRAAFLQKVPLIRKFHPWFKIIMPTAVESFDLRDFDLVISSSHEFSHGVLVKPSATLIAYYFSPSRILWDWAHQYPKDFKLRNKGEFKTSLLRAGQHILRLWDYQAAQRVDVPIADSKHVAERIKKFYGREAKVIYPPVSLNSKLETLNSKQIQNYFLIVSQLYPHKNIDLAIEAFSRVQNGNYQLLVIGEGPERKHLKKLIRKFKASNVRLLGFVPDQELPQYYQNCLAYLMCNEEDFGITPIEAMLYGKPVLALRSGGALESVIEGVTGEFFDQTSPDILAQAVQSIHKKIRENYFSGQVIKKHAEKFTFEKFQREILDLVGSLGYNQKTHQFQ